MGRAYGLYLTGVKYNFQILKTQICLVIQPIIRLGILPPSEKEFRSGRNEPLAMVFPNTIDFSNQPNFVTQV